MLDELKRKISQLKVEMRNRRIKDAEAKKRKDFIKFIHLIKSNEEMRSICWVIRDLEIQKRRKAESEKKEREDRLKERERKKFYDFWIDVDVHFWIVWKGEHGEGLRRWNGSGWRFDPHYSLPNLYSCVVVED